jgi:uncharacterized CHY-type Zn-finger protein
MQFTPINYTCPGCGAPLKYSPATNTLRCEFCKKEYPIQSTSTFIVEHDLHSALKTLDSTPNQEIVKEITCTKCGGSFTLDPYTVSANCPYCGTPAITEFVNDIKPESILPFQITHKDAQARFAGWIGSLWFAPSSLKHLVDTQKSLAGYYLPYWTYDADTLTEYTGQRGDIYYVTVQRREMINGREQIVNVQEPRIRWTPVSGRVSRRFDDVVIRASRGISRRILDAIGPWDTSQLVPFDTKYLSGFDSEEYTIGLDNGFEMARVKMDDAIRSDIQTDIGGDRQQITSMQTRYEDTTYKNALFPVWMTHFDYNNKQYYYAINGRSGKITGERPYSYTKIILLAASIMAVFFLAAFFDDIRATFQDHYSAPSGPAESSSEHYFQTIQNCENHGGVWDYVNDTCELQPHR